MNHGAANSYKLIKFIKINQLWHFSNYLSNSQINSGYYFCSFTIIRNVAHRPKATQTNLRLVGGLCVPQQSFSRDTKVRLKSSHWKKKKFQMMKVGQQGEATDWWSPVGRERRGIVSWGRQRQMLKELFVALIERIGESTEHLVHGARLLLLQLVNSF